MITTCPTPNHTNCPYAQEIADRAVKKTFAILGVDINSPSDVEKFRMDLRFGASIRKLVERGMGGVALIIAAAIVTAIWSGVLNGIGRNH